jgi:hypothetical protein
MEDSSYKNQYSIDPQHLLKNAYHRLIRDEKIHADFIQNGFVHLKRVIDEQTISILRSFYLQHFNTSTGMYVTHHFVNDVEKNKSVSNFIFSNLKVFLDKFFINFRPLIGHFAAKANGGEGLFNFHQDWSIVDERQYGVAHCWIPLQDVNKVNGTLAVLPKTHLLFSNYRSGTCPIRFTPLDRYEQEAVHLSASVGDMIVYHPALFHGSGKNFDKRPRIAVVAAIAHHASENVYFHGEGVQKVTMYELTEIDLFSRLNELSQGHKPLGRVIKSVEPCILQLNDSELEMRIKSFYQT